MRERIIRLLPKTSYDFSALPAESSVPEIPFAQNVDISDAANGTLLVRVHAATFPDLCSFRVDARVVAPTSEDATHLFRERTVATVVGVAGLVTPPCLLRGRLAAHAGALVSLYLTPYAGGKAGTFTFTISVDLLLQEGTDGWTPAALGSKLRLWLDQRDLVAVSGAYSDWGDQSPTGAHDFTQATASLRPASGSTLSYWPAPDFEGTNDYLGGAVLSNFISANANHVFAVLRAQTVTGINATPYLNNGVIADFGLGWWGLYLKTVAGEVQVHGFHWDSNLRDAIALGLELGNDALVEWSYDGTTLRCQVGGGVVATAAGGGSIGDLTNLLRIGNGASGSLYLDGAIASILVCNAYLGGVEARNVRDYLSSKYGVPS